MHAPNAVGNQYPKKLENHGNSGKMLAVTVRSSILYKEEGDYMEKTNKVNWDLLKIEFIRQRDCKTLKSFCEVKGLNYGYIKQIAAKEGWVKERKKWQEQNEKSDSQIDELDITRAMGDKLLMDTLPALMNAWDELINAAANRNVYRNSEGEFSSIKYNRIMECFERLLSNIKACTFHLDSESRAKIYVAYQNLEMKKKRQQDEDGVVIEDNFLDALEKAGEAVWKEEE